MTETWRKIYNSEYEISTYGRLKNAKGRISNATGGKKRYHCISYFDKDGKKINTSMHFLVAETFLKMSKIIKQNENIGKVLEIDHKDHNKKNNKLTNLRWVTHKENVDHAFASGAIDTNKISKAKVKGIIYIDENNKEIEFISREEASIVLNVDKTLIGRILNKKDKPRWIKESKKHGEMYVDFRYKETFEDLEDEVWKSLESFDKDYSHYLVSNKGRMKNLNSKRYLTGGINGRYMMVKLSSYPFNKGDCKKQSTALHRLVAFLFVDNPDKKPYVNHLDSDPRNNVAANLEWCTHKENMIHANENKLCNSNNLKRFYYKLELDGTIIEEFEGATDEGNISSVASKSMKKRTHYNGYGYCYKEDYKEPIVNPALLRIFPEVDVKNVKGKEQWDTLRKYIKNNEKPIWKIELDGARLEITSIMEQLDKNMKNVGKAVINNSTAHGYGWKRANYLDVINYPTILSYEKIPHKILNKFNLDQHNKIDYELLRKIIASPKSGSIPVWKIDHTGKRIKKYNSLFEARDQNGLGRETVEAVVRGRSKATDILGKKIIWEEARYYIKEENDSYRKIPLKDRYYSKIIQKDMDGEVIKIWKNRYEIKKELGFNVSLSYHTQNGFIFDIHKE